MCAEVGGDGDFSEGLLHMVIPMSNIPEWECRSPFEGDKDADGIALGNQGRG